jgi:hypothetical protein
MCVPHRKNTYWPPRPVRGWLYLFVCRYLRTSQKAHLWASTFCYGIAFFFYIWMMSIPHRKHAYASLRPVMGLTLFSHVRTLQETHLRACTACYVDSITFLYVDDVRISQETHLWASIAFYGDIFTFLHVDDIRTSQEGHRWASTACTVLASFFCVWCSYLTGNTPMEIYGQLRG